MNEMKSRIYYLLIVIVSLLFVWSCDDYDMFKKELYYKYLYVISDDDNIHDMMFSLDTDTAFSAVSVSCSGTNPVDEEIRFTLEKDLELLDKYNYANFDINEEKYAKELSSDDFYMPSMSAFLKRSSEQVYTTLPIYMTNEKLAELSPDSIYFVPLKIKDASGYEINEKKHNVLCRVYKKNRFADTRKDNQYTMKGYRTQGIVKSSISGTKTVHPLTDNSVRMFVGNVRFVSEVDSISKYAMEVKVNLDSTLLISPYSNEGKIELEQLDPLQEDQFIYNNKYETSTNRFLLYYRYRVINNQGTWSNWITIQEAVKKLVVTEED